MEEPYDDLMETFWEIQRKYKIYLPIKQVEEWKDLLKIEGFFSSSESPVIPDFFPNVCKL